MKRIFCLVAVLIATSTSAQYQTEQQSMVSVHSTPTAAMATFVSQLYPLAMMPMAMTGVSGTFQYQWTSYTNIAQLATFETGACSVTAASGQDPYFYYDQSVGCHLGQFGWSVRSVSSAYLVKQFFDSLTPQEQATFMCWRAPGLNMSEDFRYVINWQPLVEYCIHLNHLP